VRIVPRYARFSNLPSHDSLLSLLYSELVSRGADWKAIALEGAVGQAVQGLLGEVPLAAQTSTPSRR
jgi:hypothetical protein